MDDGKKIIATGRIYTPDHFDDEFSLSKLDYISPHPTDIQMTRSDVYSVFDSHGYYHGDTFKGIQSICVGQKGMYIPYTIHTYAIILKHMLGIVFN